LVARFGVERGSLSSWWREIAKIRDGVGAGGFVRVSCGRWGMSRIHFSGPILGSAGSPYVRDLGAFLICQRENRVR
jgi:hypothetical protein